MKKRIISLCLSIIMMIAVFSAISLTGVAGELSPSSDSGYTVYRAKGYLFGIKGNTTVSTFKSMFEGQSISVTDPEGNRLMNSDYISTGSILALSDGTDKLTVIVSGDVDANGRVNASDCAALKAYFKGTVTLNGACLSAADGDGSGVLTVTDYIMIKRQVAGTYTINKVSPEYVPKTTVPDVVGYTAENARIEIERKGFVYNETFAYSNTVKSGYVISQNPESSKQVPGSTVTVVVSKGKQYTTRVNYLDNMKAIWLSQFDLAEIWSTSSATTFRANIKSVLQNCANKGINTVFVQCRPNGDATYKSGLFPWSKYVFSSVGYSQTATKSYDPLAITVEEAHNLNISVHAWINPLRLMTPSEMTNVSSNYKIKQWYNNKRGTYVVQVGDYLYLNPAYEEVRQLILDGAREIMENYDVDGLHLDDYFYPTTEAYFDQAAFNSSGFQNVYNFRRYNMNLLVSGLYSTTKSVDIDLVFGVSPAGEPNRVVNYQCADVRLWSSSDDYIDYIMPQLYYDFQHPSEPFSTICQEWSSIVTSSSVKYYVGLALYKATNPESRSQYDGPEWASSDDVIKRQIQYCDNSLPKCKGVCLFSYQDLVSTTSEGKNEVNNMVPALKAFSN